MQGEIYWSALIFLLYNHEKTLGQLTRTKSKCTFKAYIFKKRIRKPSVLSTFVSLIHSCLLCYSIQIKIVSTSATQKSHGLSFRLSVRGKIYICPKYTLVLVHSVIWGKYVACSPGSSSFTFLINAIYSNLWQLFERLALHFLIYKEAIYIEGEKQ